MTAPRAPAICFAIPGDIATLTGGYIYDRRVIDALRSADVPVDHVELPSSFPFPGEEDVKTSMNLLQARRKDAALMIDGLAFGALPHEQARSLGAGVIALCHHPLGLENGLPPEKARYLLENEKLNLQGVAHVIVSS
ncbi:MAG: glycosyl transferase family 1, partial [Hyphomicrobiales bacterium]|nr:glycosyl transferase family 1 [Hyphomicrobiales bacterium]